MNAIQQIFQQHGAAYCATHAVSEQQRKVIAAISHCRTSALGMMHFHCGDCVYSELAPRSCGNRHCPVCDGVKGAHWLHKQLGKRLPTRYFLLTFTIPSELRPLALYRSDIVYDLMMKSVANTLKDIGANPRHLGADRLGFTAVLHTWGRQLQYHPHVHVVVPAGGLSEDGDLWRASSPTFFLPDRVLSRRFRTLMINGLEKSEVADQVPRNLCSKDWVVDTKAGDGVNALKYLARYVFRVAVTADRIESVTDTHVVIRYRKVGSKRTRRLPLTIDEFIRRYLLHVLPAGFVKVRHYGFMHPNSSVSVDTVRELIEDECDTQDLVEVADADVDIPPPPCCPHCNKPMTAKMLSSGVPSIRQLADGLPRKAG